MTSKLILIAYLLLLLCASNGFCQNRKWSWGNFDVNGKSIIVGNYRMDDIIARYDYSTEQGDSLKAIPFVGKYVDCSIGSDSLKKAMIDIYYDNHNKHYEYDYLNLKIYAYLLLNEQLNVEEIRMTSVRREEREDNEFVLDICRDFTGLFRTLKWMKTQGFPESATYSFVVIVFWNNPKYLYGDILPY